MRCLHTSRHLLSPSVLSSLKKAVAVTPLLVSKFCLFLIYTICFKDVLLCLLICLVAVCSSSMTELRFCHRLYTVKELVFVTHVLTHPYNLPFNRPPNHLTNSLTNRWTRLCGAVFKKVIVIHLAKILPILTHMNPVGMFPPCLLWFIFKCLHCCLKEEILV